VKKLILLLFIGSTGFFSAHAGKPANGGGKGKNCRNAAPDAMEDFLFAGPSADHEPVCQPQQDQKQQGMIAFYRWYLENAPRISIYEAREHTCREDIFPPLRISWKRLQHYAAYIRKSYPELDTIKVNPKPGNLSLHQSPSPQQVSSRSTGVFQGRPPAL